MTRGALLAAFAALAVGCADKTSLLVEVTSSLAVPADIDQVELHASGRTSGTMATQRWDLSSPFPQTISIRPAGSHSEEVIITVTALKAGELVVRRVVTERFEDGSEKTVVVDLARDCVGVRCAEGVDCQSGRCVSGSPLDGGTDAGDAAMDAPTDSMPDAHDAGTDAGDSGPPACQAAECEDGDDCTDDACGPPGGPSPCLHTTRDRDHDGHGDPSCRATGGVPADDCDDTNVNVFRDAPERCDGLDDNCDGRCDESFACCSGMSEGCTTACGSMGSHTCDGMCSWSECVPPAETCNGTDDDCDGTCDNGVGCCAGQETSCTTACGTRGTTSCLDDCMPGPCLPGPETCNGNDDDCDGMVDEGFPCVAGSSASCTTSCGSSGTRACASDCHPSLVCVPPAEECYNGRDDNCDGTVDEGCMVACDQSCGGATVVMPPGGRFTSVVASSSNTGSCGGTGYEGLYTFTITTASDVFVTTHNTADVDTVLYVRACRCMGPEIACNDDSDGLRTSVLQLSSLAAGTYNLFVDTKSSSPVPVTVDIHITPPSVAGDRCGHPLPLTATASGNTCGLNSDVSGACEFPPTLNGPDAVYYFVVTGTASRRVVVDTCTGCTNYDTSLDVRSTCLDTGSVGRVNCLDDGCHSSCFTSGEAFQTNVGATMDPGLYYVFVDGYGTNCGNYTLTATGL